MKLFRNTIVALSLLLTLPACQEVVELNLRNVTPKLVVDGAITDQPGPHYIRLSTSASYYAQGETPRVTDAVVTLSDDAGNTEVLQHLETAPGTYQSTEIPGVVGRTYYLKVEYRGGVYQSQAFLPAVTDIDRLEVRFVPGSPLKQEGYYLYFYAQEPRDEKNYYRWFVYRNDSLYNGRNDLLIANDEMVQGDIEGLELGYAFEEGDRVRLEMHSLTREVYEYYVGLRNVYFNDGGLFSPPPVNPTSNISNGALGVFRASSVRAGEVNIE
jgi:hypothetical protein